MFILLFRILILYFIVILAVRLMGKKQIGELQPSELVITILISELASVPIQDKNQPLVVAILQIFTLVCLELIVSLVTLKSVRMRSVLFGRPSVLIYKGKFRQNVMEHSRVTVDDIMEVMRNNGVLDIDEVDYAILETNGQLSIIEKNQYRPLCANDIGIKNQDSGGIPHLIIVDGKVMGKNLKESGRNKTWLTQRLKQDGYKSVKEVFLMTLDDNGKVYLVGKK